MVKKLKIFGPFKSLQESIPIRLSFRYSKISRKVKQLITWLIIFHFVTKSLAIFKSFGPFKLLQYSILKKVFHPETPKYVVKPRNIAYKEPAEGLKIQMKEEGAGKY